MDMDKLTRDEWFELLTLVERDNATQREQDEPENTDLEQKLIDIVYGGGKHGS